ncbi:ABC transporter ATP-binding protein [Nocardioides sp. SYSU D00065]|uniref:ABC transporter ATP-binding protein n=1 Tax=Nocardioides sp. SYSU D00065 TaxID=2817378 RepID=UPI001B32D008|nr:ABC transporter ATP-binding protein [Nocardioides sp. SYSU D00065]
MSAVGGHDRGIALAGVSKSFDVGGESLPALAPTTLDIAPGEFVTLAGPSGCGKTTLLRILAGFTVPSEGTVTVSGEPVRGPGHERGVVFQQPTLFPWMSVRRNVEVGPRFQGVPAAERRARVDRYLDMVGLAAFGEHRPYELSGGMQQRCQIARVLAGDPDIVLMDEPFGALDALTRERLQGELLQIWRETGKTVLFITHSVDEAVYLGSRVLVMSPRPGRIVFDAPARFGRAGERVPVEEIRSLPEYADLTSQVRRAIHADVA